MFDINPETQRHHLAELERQMQPRSRSVQNGECQVTFLERVKNVPFVLVFASFILGGFAGGALM